MTTYQGGKKRIGKRIYQVISLVENDLLQDDFKMSYFEPFCGMCSVLKYFAADNDREVFACDIHPDLIMMWQALQDDWIPPSKCGLRKYEQLKNSKPSPERAFVGFALGFNGNFFKGNGSYKKKGLEVGKRGVMSVAQDLKNVEFIKSASYNEFDPKNMLIYCDPPYFGNNLSAQVYDFFDKFDHNKFWDVMRKWSKNNIVIVSEWKAPSDFICVWSAETTCSNTTSTVKYQDCLFIHRSLYRLLSKEVLREIKKI